MSGPSPEAASAPLDAATRARGRRLAIASHPAGMTFRTIFTEWVPTLALVGLGPVAARSVRIEAADAAGGRVPARLPRTDLPGATLEEDDRLVVRHREFDDDRAHQDTRPVGQETPVPPSPQ